MNAENSFIILPRLFDKDKPFILIDISFCEKNENKSKDLIKKFHHFANGKFFNNISYSINWITKTIIFSFPLKDKNLSNF